MTSPSITKLRITDFPQLLQLERTIFQLDAFSLDMFVALFLNGRDTFLVAREGSKLVGYIVASYDDGMGYIASIGVAESARGNGLGRRLMESVMARLRDKGARVIGLHVRLDNIAAIHLYEQLGFITIETVPHYYGDGASGLYMEREGE